MMKLARSPFVQPPAALTCGLYGPSVVTPRLPYWLSWYHRLPWTGSIRANMPSPPLRNCHMAGSTSGLLHTYTEDPLSCAPALTPGLGELAKSAVISPE